jgi:hypothetical protein
VCLAKCNFVIHRPCNNVTSARCKLVILKALLILAKHKPLTIGAINDGFDRRVYDPTSVHVDLDAVANREIIYTSFGFVICGWLFLHFHSNRASPS